MANAYPLEWPDGWKRTASYARRRAQFNAKATKYNGSSSYQYSRALTVADASSRLLKALEMMGAQTCVISTNVVLRLDGQPRSGQAEPSDPGAAVYWSQGNNQRCIAVDRYDRVADNLAAIAATLEAMRAIERHGGAEILNRTFEGFKTLPAKASQPWRDVLDLHGAVTVNLVNAKYRELSKLHHPDLGGDRDLFEAITIARKDALQELSA